MKTYPTRIIFFALLLSVSCFVSGCATLSITPQQQFKETTSKQPVTLGIQVNGERMREILGNPQESAATAASGKLFDKVILLPAGTRSKSPSEIKAEFGTDYILTGSISDISVAGNLNPYWYIAIPLLFFKPFAPIVTFEANVILESSLWEAKTGNIILQKNISSTVTDHYSPIEPQDKVRKLVGRGINNAFVTLLEETQQKIATPK